MKDFMGKVSRRLLHYERRFVNNPLLTVPEFAGRISTKEQMKYGPDARNCQEIADKLLFAVQYTAGAAVDGDIAEFGCMSGRTATVLAAAMAAFRLNRNLHLFDSFEGLPESKSEPDQKSFHVKDGVWGPGTCKGISPAKLREKCARYIPDDKIIIYEGWFADTLARVPAGTKFGMLHVDCDLYVSTIDALKNLFQRGMVAEGAVMLFDDWNCNRAANHLGERKAWQEIVAKFKVEFSDGGDYGWAGHKMTIHSYTP